MSYYETIPKSEIPEGKSGPWSIEKFTITESEAKFENIRAAFSFTGGGRTVRPGTYTRLRYHDSVIMSDTPCEIRDHFGFVRRARGNVLINGLGLGLCLAAVLRKPEVTKITVIEIDPDVIGLVAPYFTDLRLTIINANALTWKAPKGESYDAVWHDIWPNICEDNLKEMAVLHRKYGRRCNWQGSWCHAECLRLRRY